MIFVKTFKGYEDKTRQLDEAVNGWMTPAGVRSPAGGVGDYLDRLQAGGVLLNVATLVPHGPLRISVKGLAAGAPSADELTVIAEDAFGQISQELVRHGQGVATLIRRLR